MLRVCVVGSLNMDLVVKVPHLPQVGETVTGGVFSTFPGGKGANQAVGAARLGACVTMVGRVGADPFGAQLVDALRREGVDVAAVGTDPESPTGIAAIGVDEQGRNLILVAPGANARLLPHDVGEAVIARSQVLLLQLEIPTVTVLHAARVARRHGAWVCLDPAPAAPLPEELYRLVDVLNPNEVEAAALTGISIRTLEDAQRAARRLLDRGPRHVVVKLGDRGSYYLSSDEAGHVPALGVKAVDTTAAGDVFAAALGVALGEGRSLRESVQFASCAAALKVTRMGAQSMPSREEVEAVLRQVTV
ncbi:MAG: ribokinase [Armatimonadota bacterium]|nr:ribokinase [Armatimonadota bacterium]MDR7394808.1 ribokinase [Armatimonadota bacterium]MDR7397500.1 ribokinase [Armatimonadota bacterium]MDR7399933.1 ribokinase [Armatimonadota bacterium]MDR7407486.1 ribokinase [Armatimonadota bacterium]